MRLSLISLLYLSILTILFCQETTYPHLTVYNKSSTELIKELKQQKMDELKDQIIPTYSSHSDIYDQTTDYLIALVENEFIIHDDEMESFVNGINLKLSKSNPELKKARKILIKKDGLQNATSYGEGTITINLGLIAQAENEDMIAFILAHENAHYHLNHLRKRIDSHLSIGSSKSVIQKIKKIPGGTMTLEDLNYVQNWFSSLFRNSRSNELEADSLAIVMLKNSGYNLNGPLEALTKLKSAYHPIYPLKTSLFEAFIFEELGFKKRWLNQQQVRESNDLIKHLLNNDSIETHPAIDLRITRIEKFAMAERTKGSQIEESIKNKSNLSLVSCFYKTRLYDFGIHHALQLKENRFQYSSFLDFKIGRMLYEIALAKNDKRLHLLVSKNTSQYPVETKALNNFFYNLTVAEAAEISYLYMKKHFNSQHPDHYRVLHNILLMTNRFSEDKKLRKDFRNRFSGENLNKYSDEK